MPHLVFPMQIRIVPGGDWHRRREGNGRNATACGIHFDEELIPATRDFKLDDKICEECHSRHEIQTGETKALAKEDARYPDDLPRSKRPSTEERRRSRRDTDVDLCDTHVDLPSSDTFLKPEPDE